MTGGTKNNQVTIDGYNTKYFTPQSKFTYEQIKTKEFAMLEDQFMECEYLTVHRGVSHLRKAIEVHQKMKEMFPSLNLNYHNLALNQIGRPSMDIDPNVRYS